MLNVVLVLHAKDVGRRPKFVDGVAGIGTLSTADFRPNGPDGNHQSILLRSPQAIIIIMAWGEHLRLHYAPVL